MSLFGKVLLNSIDSKLETSIPVAKKPTLFKSRDPSAKKIYYVSKLGLRHPIDSFDTFQQYNFNLNSVLKIHPELVDMLETGAGVNLTFLPG